ncbi:MAG: phosphatase PAP2 family protein [Hydrotalea flava]|uniref:phosphatase PAP2 family protein n=1 Tax=Hydrotalea lipotrueae TaxID=2803817 RepID=UPI0016A623E7|nr:phosphatase PAP2 family protein [Hydrotalea lipotrueae]MBY0348558.1 phosphatase PAP2 family protein [Hydrotalea flava]NIM35994.1 phosphatase PAP2 family protein [Hydrotalea flava]NIM38827.1 phosphatase PAP2 family protein [Hydrotalea flava]NIN04031.1 phosphatase PAP2 family protein [Hydrotalea flava]NIN15736.1 phosphatase PAP2 family protein [Hydrotalea flava]
MKKIIFISIVAVTAIVFACNKNAPDITANLSPLQPQNVDLNAGSWKTILLPRPDTFAVAAPNPVSSADYKAELNEIKGYQKNLTSSQMATIQYWAAGGVLRWNELMRGLVTKYNLPAYQNPDNSYPIPNANNPFAYPLFPFANPPYAARAYAYISAAQYDALVACWYYKKLYNRAAPYTNDSTIQAKVTTSTLPSYPSEAAVMAGVTAEMMKLLFPTEIANIEQKAKEQELSMMMAGAATRSDIAAGEALGRQVAEVFIARAKADNAGKAVGTSTDWKNFETVAMVKGEIPWYSLESPKRPPMLPLFGNVIPFLFPAATVPSFRPAPPPATHGQAVQQAAAEVYEKIKSPTRENIQHVQFWADGVGTFTPPGHWDAIAAQDFITKNFSEVRWARNYALLNMALMDAAIVCWDVKYYYFNPRPTQMNPAIKTLTGIPNFPSYISGHSTFSGAAATILAHIVPEQASKYWAMANQASMSRLEGGIHYKVDCDTGLVVGSKVGNYAVLRAKQDGAE